MKAGEPVIPFYPLADVIGAAPLLETYGENIKIKNKTEQESYWEDKNASSWSISGGDAAWFKMHFYYPLLVDFWWPLNKKVQTIDPKNSSKTLDAKQPELGGFSISSPMIMIPISRPRQMVSMTRFQR